MTAKPRFANVEFETEVNADLEVVRKSDTKKDSEGGKN